MMYLRDHLKVLGNLKADCCINVSKLARETDLTERQVKSAIAFLKKSSIISDNGSKVKILINRLN